jgi:hypothetical protein
MAAGMIQKKGQDGGLRTYTPYKRPSLIQTLFGKISTKVDVGRIVESTNVHYKMLVKINIVTLSQKNHPISEHVQQSLFSLI